MKHDLRHVCFVAILTILLALPATAQQLALSGAFYEPGSRFTDQPLRGFAAYLYDPQNKNWIGPSLTDDAGFFAFYDLPAGKYLLRLYSVGEYWKTEQWEQSVTVPGDIGKLRLPSISQARPHCYIKKKEGDKFGRYRVFTEVQSLDDTSAIKRVRYLFSHENFAEGQTGYFEDRKAVFTSTDPIRNYRVFYLGGGCLDAVTIEIDREEYTQSILVDQCAAIRATLKK